MLGFSQNWEIGALLGGTAYDGDINCLKHALPRHFGASGGLNFRRNLGNNFALRGNVLFGQLTGRDTDYPKVSGRTLRAFSFTSPLTEFSLQGEIFPFGNYKKTGKGDARTYKKRFMSPYVLIGVGGAYTNPTTNYNQETTRPNPVTSDAAIDADRAASKKKAYTIVPVGGGIRFNFGRLITVSTEFALRKGTYDYLDGVSQAGNPKNKDWYAIGGLNFARTFGRLDRDKDGVFDDVDKCPDVPGLKMLGGCPDADADGVADNEDNCPNVAGLKTLRGCPDADKDGITDLDDECPDEAGIAAFKGCPDSDNDGVPDKEDKCPKEAGRKDKDGCPFLDQDNDGIADAQDGCPDVPGLAKFKGCPDTDGDGVEDSKDKCPKVPGTDNGCPPQEIKEEIKTGGGVDGATGLESSTLIKTGTENSAAGSTIIKTTEIKTNTNSGGGSNTIITGGGGSSSSSSSSSSSITYTSDASTSSVVTTSDAALDLRVRKIYFSTSQANLFGGENLNVMNEVLYALQNYPDYNVRISGHTDNVGNAASNRLLSEARAKAVRDWFIGNGISAKRLSYFGYGSARPDASNADESSRQMNRRVEFELFAKNEVPAKKKKN
jgi:OmpA-OmpF porin, OOP family